LGNVLLPDEFECLASAADFSVPANDQDFPTSEHFMTAKTCMSVVDKDRNFWAEEHGYTTFLNSLCPLYCSPKNNIIEGKPS